MTEELFDVVDINDQPTGQKVTKVEAHEQKILHRCAAVYVLDEQGGLYVQEHLKSGGLFDHTVGGHVSTGEDYLTAAIRETEEEIGLSGVDLEEVATSYHSDEGTYLHMFGIYKCTAPKSWVFEPNEEVQKLILMDFDDVVQLMQNDPSQFTGGFLNTMKKYLEVTSSK